MKSRTASTRRPSEKVLDKWPPKEGRKSKTSVRTRSASARPIRRRALSRRRSSSTSTKRKLRTSKRQKRH